MNDRDRLLKAMSWLLRNYPNANITQEDVYAYVDEHLTGYPVALIEAAIRDVSRNRFFPGPNEIIEKAAELYLDCPPYGQALRMVEEAALKGKPSQLPEIVRAAVNTLGGTRAWRESENKPTLRAQFRDIYASDVESLKGAFFRGELGLGPWPREQRLELVERVEEESEALPEVTEAKRLQNIKQIRELVSGIGVREISPAEEEDS